MILSSSLVWAVDQSATDAVAAGILDPAKSAVVSPPKVDENEVLRQVLKGVPSNDAKENAEALNKKITELNKTRDPKLPLIDVDSPTLQITPAYIHGFAGSDLVGAEIRDGKNRFCFPCEKGFNTFAAGVMPEKKVSKADALRDMKKKLKEAWGDCEYDEAQSSIVPVRSHLTCKMEYVCHAHLNCDEAKKVAKEDEELGPPDVEVSCFVKDQKCPDDPFDCAAGLIPYPITKGTHIFGKERPFQKRDAEKAATAKAGQQ